VLDQVLRYNIGLPVPYLAITNGRYCAAFHKNEGQLEMMDFFPDFEQE